MTLNPAASLPFAARKAAALAGLLLLLAPSWLLAQSPQSLLGVEGESQATEAPTPDPRNLPPGWWSYMGEAEGELSGRLDKVIASVDEAVLSLSVADTGTIPQRAEVAKERLRAYVEEATRAVDRREITVRTEGDFTLQELFESASQIRRSRAALDDLAENLSGSAELLRQARDRYDAQILTYRQAVENSVEAIGAGIDAMASRAELAVLELRNSRAEARQERLNRQLLQYQAQLANARQNLVSRDWNAEEALAELDQIAVELSAAEEELASERQHLLEVDETTPEGQVAANLVRQELLAALLATTRLQFTQARQRAVLVWHQARTEAGSNRAILERALTGLRELLTQADREFSGWQRLTISFLLEPPGEAVTARARDLRNQDQRARELAVDNLSKLRELDALIAQTRLMEELLERDVAGAEMGLAGLWSRTRYALSNALETVQGWGDVTWFHVSDNPITTRELGKVLLILMVTFVLSWIVRNGLKRMKDRRHITQTHSLYAASRILHYLIITIGLLFGLSTLGLDFTSIALIAGALSVGIGFGLQTTVNNFVSGLILLFDRSLKVGDYVELDSGLRGTVREISVRATRINTNDNVDVVVPNSEFVSTRLVNWTMVEGFARLRVRFGVAYGTDKELVKRVALEATERVEYTLTHMPSHLPQIRLINFGDNSLDFELLVWVNRSGVQRPGRARAAYMWELETGLHDAGIEIPFPQRDIHIRSNATLRQSGEENSAAVFELDRPRPTESGSG